MHQRSGSDFFRDHVEDGTPFADVACSICCVFFFQAEDGIRDSSVTGVQTCALPISLMKSAAGDSVVLQLPGGTEYLTVLEVCYQRIAVEPFREPPGSEASATRLSQIGRASCRERV